MSSAKYLFTKLNTYMLYLSANTVATEHVRQRGDYHPVFSIPCDTATVLYRLYVQKMRRGRRHTTAL